MQAYLHLHLVCVEGRGLRAVRRVRTETAEKVAHHVMLTIGPMGHVVHVQTSKGGEQFRERA